MSHIHKRVQRSTRRAFIQLASGAATLALSGLGCGRPARSAPHTVPGFLPILRATTLEDMIRDVAPLRGRYLHGQVLDSTERIVTDIEDAPALGFDSTVPGDVAEALGEMSSGLEPSTPILRFGSRRPLLFGQFTTDADQFLVVGVDEEDVGMDEHGIPQFAKRGYVLTTSWLQFLLEEDSCQRLVTASTEPAVPCEFAGCSIVSSRQRFRYSVAYDAEEKEELFTDERSEAGDESALSYHSSRHRRPARACMTGEITAPRKDN